MHELEKQGRRDVARRVKDQSRQSASVVLRTNNTAGRTKVKDVDPNDAAKTVRAHLCKGGCLVGLISSFVSGVRTKKMMRWEEDENVASSLTDFRERGSHTGGTNNFRSI